MQINWEIVTCLFIGFFAIVGFSRGWWKEGLTTIFLLILFIFLQQPNLAQSFIDVINSLLNTVWGLIPEGLIMFSEDFIAGTGTGASPIQADAASPGTWVVILILFVAASIFLGRFWLGNSPTMQGSLLGVLIGALNGFLALNLVREYLDGRGLPGNTAMATSSRIILAGNTSFSPPASSVSIQAADLPDFTILDSTIPWFIIGGGLLIAFAVLKTRFKIDTNNKGMKKLNYKEVPPFYAIPKKPKPKIEDCLKVLSEAQQGGG